MKLTIILILWAACAPVTYRGTVTYFQSKWPEIAKDSIWEDRGMAALFALLGPFGLFVAFIASGFFHKGFSKG